MKELFSSNNDIRKTAFLNWRTYRNEDINNLIVLADGYLTSSIQLIDLCLNDNDDNKADNLIFPILHNANHGIELYLKSMIWTINQLKTNKEKFSEIHELDILFQETLNTIQANKDLVFFEHFNKNSVCLANYIEELYSKLDNSKVRGNMFFSRYPISKTDKKTKNYEKQFYIVEDQNITIDLENYKGILENIYLFLDERISYLYFNELQEDY